MNEEGTASPLEPTEVATKAPMVYEGDAWPLKLAVCGETILVSRRELALNDSEKAERLYGPKPGRNRRIAASICVLCTWEDGQAIQIEEAMRLPDSDVADYVELRASEGFLLPWTGQVRSSPKK